MLENNGVENDETMNEVQEVLRLPNIDSEVTDLILEWFRNHKDDKESEKEDVGNRCGRDSKDKSVVFECNVCGSVVLPVRLLPHQESPFGN